MNETEITIKRTERKYSMHSYKNQLQCRMVRSYNAGYQNENCDAKYCEELYGEEFAKMVNQHNEYCHLLELTCKELREWSAIEIVLSLPLSDDSIITLRPVIVQHNYLHNDIFIMSTDHQGVKNVDKRGIGEAIEYDDILTKKYDNLFIPIYYASDKLFAEIIEELSTFKNYSRMKYEENTAGTDW
jgi:hypothetical protein